MKIHLPSIANTLGSVLTGKIGMGRVIFDGHASTASTDGKDVFLPTFVDEGDENAACMLRGFLAHEIVGHIRHTDFTFLEEWSHTASPLARGIWNIIEDARIERAAWSVLPGVRSILHKTVEVLKGRSFFDLPQNPEPANTLTSFLLLSLRANELKQPLDTVPAAALAAMVFGSKLRDEILQIATKGSRGQSTQDVAAAADEIIALLKKAGHAQQQQDEGDQDQQQGRSQGNNAQTQRGQDQSGNQSRDNQDQDGNQSQQDQKSKKDGDQKGNQPQKGEISEAVREAAKKALAAGEKEVGKTDIGAAMSDRLVTRNGTEPLPISRSVVNHNWRPSQGAMKAARRLSATLELKLQAKTEEEDLLGRRGRLCGKRLARTKLLDLDVFHEEGDEMPGLNTAVALLIDRSGSMGDAHFAGSRLFSAIASATALGEAMAPFESQGISLATYSFDSRVILLKGFGEAWAQKRGALGYLTQGGSTYFQQALLTVSQDIIKRKEQRKIIFCITDEDLGYNCAPVIQTMRDQGIEVISIFVGIQDCSAKQTAEDAGLKIWGVVQNPADIPKAVFKTLETVF